MNHTFKTVLIGASYYALGYSASHGDCLILEESQQAGGDFHAMLHPADMREAGEKEAKSDLGRLMKKYGVWTEKGFDLLKAAPVAHAFAARLIGEGREILLDCRILSVEQANGCFTVRFFCNEGICEVMAEQVIDTTVNRVTDSAHVRCVRQTLNAFTVAQTAGFDGRLKGACPECRIIPGFNENEKLLCFPAAADESVLPAYRRMTDAWRRAFPEGDERILFVADTMDGVYEHAGDGPAAWNGGRFSNPVTAFVKGGEAE